MKPVEICANCTRVMRRCSCNLVSVPVEVDPTLGGGEDDD